jgi:hypothetical protein
VNVTVHISPQEPKLLRKFQNPYSGSIKFCFGKDCCFYRFVVSSPDYIYSSAPSFCIVHNSWISSSSPTKENAFCTFSTCFICRPFFRNCFLAFSLMLLLHSRATVLTGQGHCVLYSPLSPLGGTARGTAVFSHLSGLLSFGWRKEAYTVAGGGGLRGRGEKRMALTGQMNCFLLWMTETRFKIFVMIC